MAEAGGSAVGGGLGVGGLEDGSEVVVFGPGPGHRTAEVSEVAR